MSQNWIFSVRYCGVNDRFMPRRAVVGQACASTVEAALYLARVPEEIRREIRADETVRKFVDGQLDPEESGYHVPCPFAAATSWLVCIGSVQAVLR